MYNISASKLFPGVVRWWEQQTVEDVKLDETGPTWGSCKKDEIVNVTAEGIGYFEQYGQVWKKLRGVRGSIDC